MSNFLIALGIFIALVLVLTGYAFLMAYYPTVGMILTGLVIFIAIYANVREFNQ